MKHKLLIILTLFILTSPIAGASPNNTSIIFEEINDTGVYLIGRINNWDEISEYGFAYSEFPLPPVLEQEVTHIEIHGKPFNRDNFSVYLQDLEQGKHYFFSTYYVINGKYYYSSSYSYATPKKAKLSIEKKVVEYTTEDISLPIDILKSREVKFGKIVVKYDNKMFFRNLEVKGIPEGGYVQLQRREDVDYSFVDINFYLDEMIELSDLDMQIVFQLDRTIKTSGYASVEFEEVNLFETNGREVSSNTENGAIHYQYKGNSENKLDKLFSDNDLVYHKHVAEESELINITHSNQAIISRWKMAFPGMREDNSRIEINNSYYVENTIETNKEIVETFSLRLNSSQKEDLIDAGVDFFYINPKEFIFKIPSEDIRQIEDNPRYLEIKTSYLPETIVRQLERSTEKVIDAYEIKATGVNSAELRFPVSESIPKRDLRVEMIDEDGNEKSIVPYYIQKADGSRYACVEASPKAVFILTAPKMQVVETTIDSTKYYLSDKVFDIKAKSYINDDGYLMLPTKILSQFFNLKVSWDAKKAQLEVFDGVKHIFNINSNIVLNNGAAHFIKNQPEFINGRVYLPQEVFEEILKVNVSFNKRDGKILLQYKR